MITTAGGWVGSWIQSRRTRTQNRADDATASEKFASAAKTLIEPLRQEVVALRTEAAALRNEATAQQTTIDKQQRKINRLETTQKANIAHIEKLDRKIVYLTHGVGVLTRQITRAGLQPEWVYSEDDDGSTVRSVGNHVGDLDRPGSDGDAQELND